MTIELGHATYVHQTTSKSFVYSVYPIPSLFVLSITAKPHFKYGQLQANAFLGHMFPSNLGCGTSINIVPLVFTVHVNFIVKYTPESTTNSGGTLVHPCNISPAN